jgi:hypothetical protein
MAVAKGGPIEPTFLWLYFYVFLLKLKAWSKVNETTRVISFVICFDYMVACMGRSVGKALAAHTVGIGIYILCDLFSSFFFEQVFQPLFLS